MFCHDHQNRNGHCDRGNDCRFIHCTRQEEDEYRRSGYLPPHIRDQVIFNPLFWFYQTFPTFQNFPYFYELLNPQPILYR